jgi:small subunit ribosomal protein S1
MADYGAFVEVAPGVEGLIHVSEMSWSQHLRSANDFLKVGQEVEAVVLTLDRDERKMSLGLKQLKNDPWETIDTKYAVGTRHFAKVRNFTNFGVFVEIEEGVDGLIHISDLSWTKKIKHPNEFTQIGAEIEVAVLEIDKENRRLSLGHKQLEENPWEELAAKYGVDTVVSGKVAEVTDKGAVVVLEDGVEGYCTARHLQKEDKGATTVGEEMNFKVIEFNRDAKRILLSHLRTWEERKEAPVKEVKVKKEKEVQPELPKMEKTTLGDLGALADLHASLAAAEKPAKKSKKESAE